MWRRRVARRLYYVDAETRTVCCRG